MTTDSRLEIEMRKLKRLLRLLENQLPPTQDSEESYRRTSILEAVTNHLLFGSLIVVKEYIPGHYRALVEAASVFGQANLAGREEPFVLRRVPEGRIIKRLAIGWLVRLHEQLSARLKAIWNQEPPRPRAVPVNRASPELPR